MPNPDPAVGASPTLAPAHVAPISAASRRRLILLAALAVVLAICFAKPLYDLGGFVIDSELFSYIPLIPVVIAYLVWPERREVAAAVRPGWGPGVGAMVLGGAVLGAYAWAVQSGWKPLATSDASDYLACMMLAFVFFLLGAGFASLGTKAMGLMALPVSLLVFAIPYPVALLAWIEHFLEATSAVTAEGFYRLSMTPVVRTGMDLALPNKITLTVAPECSGIHSTLILLVTSLLAGHLFLRRPSHRAYLAAFVIPLAILRNGFRIWVIGEMCVHIGPEQIDSPIHHKGGPIFFALSLIPFFGVLVLLRKMEARRLKAVNNTPAS